MLMTKWGKTIQTGIIHPEYPRPQMVRDTWQHLNGTWQYAITPRAQDSAPESFEGEILVPFPIESELSGVARRVSETEALWYRRFFEIQKSGGRVLLHFGAVDWETRVWINGQEVGDHSGGYDPFTFDITSALRDSGQQEIIVRVWDPSDQSHQPRGKQVNSQEGIWYTPTTGIWQTVWLELVPERYISGFKIVCDVDSETVKVSVELSDGAGTIVGTVFDGAAKIAEVEASSNSDLALKIPGAKRWSPESPFLYDLEVALMDGDTVVDSVNSYFGMRKVEIKPDSNGVLRIFLNDQPVFNYGLLDQGFWPDGLYTPPSDDALKYDIEITKQLGFNTIRKHVKVEPARWYYWADKLGVLVWQDMPSGDKNMKPGEGDMERTEASARQFELEYERMVDYLYNHPSIVMWVVFNEGWGQFDTVRITEFAQSLDHTRLINSVTGWTDMGVGDVHDIHRYPGPDIPPASPGRALVLGEFGGLGLPVEGHMWKQDFWGYRAYDTVAELTAAYSDLLEQLRPLIQNEGLAAAIYTQTTDVETEANGMLTYDRAVIKMDVDTVRQLNEKLYGLF